MLSCLKFDQIFSQSGKGRGRPKKNAEPEVKKEMAKMTKIPKMTNEKYDKDDKDDKYDDKYSERFVDE